MRKFTLEEIEELILQNISYAGVLDSNEKRRGYEIAIGEIITIIKGGQ